MNLTERMTRFKNDLIDTRFIDFVQSIANKYNDVYYHIIAGEVRVFCQISLRFIDCYKLDYSLPDNYVIKHSDNELDIEY